MRLKQIQIFVPPCFADEGGPHLSTDITLIHDPQCPLPINLIPSAIHRILVWLIPNGEGPSAFLIRLVRCWSPL